MRSHLPPSTNGCDHFEPNTFFKGWTEKCTFISGFAANYLYFLGLPGFCASYLASQLRKLLHNLNPNILNRLVPSAWNSSYLPSWCFSFLKLTYNIIIKDKNTPGTRAASLLGSCHSSALALERDESVFANMTHLKSIHKTRQSFNHGLDSIIIGLVSQTVPFKISL